MLGQSENQRQYQIDSGHMDKFVAWSSNGGLTMGYYDATNVPKGKLAQQFVLDGTVAREMVCELVNLYSFTRLNFWCRPCFRSLKSNI